MLAPAFGEEVTFETKDVPADAFAPRGNEVRFLGCSDTIRHGIYVGTNDLYGWSV